jgi:cation:H+ antiporter
MLTDFSIVFGGAAAILVLAEVVIRETLRLAHHYGFSGTFAGLTVLSIGTSLLEIVTHVIGSIHILIEPRTLYTMSGLLLGSNVGSDIFQQNFVLPLVGLLAAVVVERRNLVIEVGGLLAASTLLWFACAGGFISRIEGALLVAAYLAYLACLGRNGVRDHSTVVNQRLAPRRLAVCAALITACFAGMALAANPVLHAATRLVATLPMSASLFGVVVLGVCAALPELATALVSVARGEKEISAGILIGSNITNPLLGVGLGALISTYAVPAAVFWYDLPVKITTGAMLYVFLLRQERLGRAPLLVLLATYFAYLSLRPALFPQDWW